MTSELEHIESFYEGYVANEWERLERHRTEFAVTQRVIAEYLPAAPAHILDAGSGPGRYALWLAAQGHAVSLLDLARGNLRFAAQKAREQGVQFAAIHHGTVTNLTAFHDAQFDAVLMLGPLYHLAAHTDRLRAIQEAKRVLKPGGVLFAAFVNRYTLLRYIAKTDPQLLPTEQAAVEAFLDTGIDRIPKFHGAFSSVAYCAQPAEIEPLMAQAGLHQLDLVGCEGIVSDIEDGVNGLEGAAWQAWVDLNHRLGKRPELHAAAIHLLYVGRNSG